MLVLVSGVARMQLLAGAEGAVDHGWLDSVVLCVWSSILVICRTSTRRTIELLGCVGLPLSLSGLQILMELGLLSCLG
jgi:hypothetical protein